VLTMPRAPRLSSVSRLRPPFLVVLQQACQTVAELGRSNPVGVASLAGGYGGPLL